MAHNIRSRVFRVQTEANVRNVISNLRTKFSGSIKKLPSGWSDSSIHNQCSSRRRRSLRKRVLLESQFFRNQLETGWCVDCVADFLLILLREALFTSVRTVKTGMCVRSSVQKVITFCEEDMRGGHVPVGKGFLNERFFRFWKVL